MKSTSTSRLANPWDGRWTGEHVVRQRLERRDEPVVRGVVVPHQLLGRAAGVLLVDPGVDRHRVGEIGARRTCRRRRSRTAMAPRARARLGQPPRGGRSCGFASRRGARPCPRSSTPPSGPARRSGRGRPRRRGRARTADRREARRSGRPSFASDPRRLPDARTGESPTRRTGRPRGCCPTGQRR